MRLRLITPPAARLVTLDQAKAHIPAAPARDYDLLDSLAIAAENTIDGPDGDLNRAVVEQTWALDLHHFPRPSWEGHFMAPGLDWGHANSERLKEWPEAIFLPLGKVSEIGDVTYYDADGAQQTVDPSTYFPVPGEDAMITPVDGACWPQVQTRRPFAASVEFTVGYSADPLEAPEAIRRGALLLVSHWYFNREAVVGVENRDSSTPLPLGVDRLLDRYRIKTRLAG